METDWTRKEFKGLSFVSTALWAENDLSKEITRDVLSTTALLELPVEKTTEKVAAALLAKAQASTQLKNQNANLIQHQAKLSPKTDRKNAPKISAFQAHPFYRLTSEQRFLLGALHVAQWPYSRLARVLNEPIESVRRKLWAARLEIYNKLGMSSWILDESGAVLSTCPELVHSDPWAQKFLDDELKNQEKLFLQGHLSTCERCRNILNQFRDFYYKIDQTLKDLIGANTPKDQPPQLEKDWASLQRLMNPTTFQDSLTLFWERPTTRWTVYAVLIAWALIALLR